MTYLRVALFIPQVAVVNNAFGFAIGLRLSLGAIFHKIGLHVRGVSLVPTLVIDDRSGIFVKQFLSCDLFTLASLVLQSK